MNKLQKRGLVFLALGVGLTIIWLSTGADIVAGMALGSAAMAAGSYGLGTLVARLQRWRRSFGRKNR